MIVFGALRRSRWAVTMTEENNTTPKLMAIDLFGSDSPVAAGLRQAGFKTSKNVVWSCRKFTDLIWSSFPLQTPEPGAIDDWAWTLDAIDSCQPRAVVVDQPSQSSKHSKSCSKQCIQSLDCGAYHFEQIILKELRERFPFVSMSFLNPANFGVSENHRRLLAVASKAPFLFPEKTHGPATKQLDLWQSELLPWLASPKPKNKLPEKPSEAAHAVLAQFVGGQLIKALRANKDQKNERNFL